MLVKQDFSASPVAIETPHGSAAASNLPSDRAATIEGFMGGVVQDLNAFWTRAFEADGRQYTPPLVRWVKKG